MTTNFDKPVRSIQHKEEILEWSMEINEAINFSWIKKINLIYSYSAAICKYAKVCCWSIGIADDIMHIKRIFNFVMNKWLF